MINIKKLTFISCILAATSCLVLFAATDVKNDGSLSTNLVSYWELDETSGTRSDSHASNDLTDNNTVTSTTGKLGTAALFTSSNSEYLSITDAAQTGLDPTTTMSISVWVKLNSIGAAQYIATKSNKYELIILSTGAVRFDIRDDLNARSRAQSTATLSTGTWYHIVATYSNSSQEAFIYINGSAITDADHETDATAIGSNTTAFYMGANSGPSGYFDGAMDEFGFWNRELSSSDASALYNAGSGIPYDAGGGGGQPVNVFIPNGLF